MADGLSHSIVFSINQDKYGLIWIGTGNGLNIYDGTEFEQLFFEPDNPHSLPDNSVEQFIFEDDSVWIATRGGLCKMDIISKKCRRIDLGNNTDIRTIYKDNTTNTLWVGTNSGLIKLDINSEEYQEFNTSNSNISHNIVRAIYKDTDENLWIGTFNKLNLLASGSTVLVAYDLKKDYKPFIKNNLVLNINPSSPGNDSMLWIGTQTGLVLFNRFTNEMDVFRTENTELTNSTIKTLHQTKNGDLWIGTDFGLAEFKNNSDIKVYLHNPFQYKSLINSIVWSIFEDKSGAIWFGTNNGISILSKSRNRFNFSPMAFSKADNISGYEVRQIIEDTEGNLWLATQYGTIQYNSEKGILQCFNSDQPEERRLSINGVKSLFEDRKGRIWMCTDGGLFVWDGQKNNFKKYSADFNSLNGLRTNYITKVFELRDGTILVNTVEGLHRAVEKNGSVTFSYIRRLGPNLHLGENNFYSFQGSKILKTDLQTFSEEVEISLQQPNANTQIQSLFLADKNKIWLGLNNGLVKYDILSKKWNFFQIKSNKNYPIISLISDNEGNIWASSYSAIIKFDPATNNFEIYPSGNEIPINRFIEDCSFKCTNNDLVFGGHDGFIRFSPSGITKSEYKSPLLITELQVHSQKVTSEKLFDGEKILEKDISFTKNLTLEYKHRSFSLEFSSLDFTNRDGIRYAYKLDESDLAWNYMSGGTGKVVYPNLRPGDYTFRVKGTNNDGVWNNEETVLNIQIKPPVWATPPLIATYIIFVLLIIGSVVYYYFNRLKMLGELKIMRIEKEHANNLSKARQQFFTNIAHELKTPLSLIIGPVEKVLQNNKLDITDQKYFQLIEKNARRLLWLTNQLLDFRQIENKSMNLNAGEFDIVEFTRNIYWLFTDKADRKNIDYSFEPKVEKLMVQMDLRKIETILFNLLSNAFKFTDKKGKIRISIDTHKTNSTNDNENKISITVEDTGIGISEEDQEQVFNRFFQAEEAVKMERGSGIGLTLVNEYVKMHDGEIELQSQKGKGSKFNIILPLKKYYPEKKTKEIDKNQFETILKPETEKSDKGGSTTDYSAPGHPVILIVEDDKEIADFILMSFREKYNVVVATNGVDALQKLSEKSPDLVVCDIIMPEMNGIEFTKKFKANPKTSHIPLILLTGQSDHEKQMEGLKSGADAYIVKPFDIELLEVRIENFLKRREQLLEYLKIDKITKPKNIELASNDEKILKQVVNCIENHISDPDLDISKLCKETGFSHSSLYRKIKSLTGQTTKEFIRTVRLRRAEQLLRTKKFTISEIMDQTGFTNHSYFSKCFRKVYNLSPKDYIDKQ